MTLLAMDRTTKFQIIPKNSVSLVKCRIRDLGPIQTKIMTVAFQPDINMETIIIKFVTTRIKFESNGIKFRTTRAI